ENKKRSRGRSRDRTQARFVQSDSEVLAVEGAIAWLLLRFAAAAVAAVVVQNDHAGDEGKHPQRREPHPKQSAGAGVRTGDFTRGTRFGRGRTRRRGRVRGRGVLARRVV